jgi:peptide/nickel transport system substrate-binding protein
MKRRSTIAATAVVAMAALVISACSSNSGGSTSTGSSGSGSSTGSASFNAGSTSIVNPSTHKGGTLTFDDSNTPDSLDGGNTYYAWVLNFNHLYELPMFVPKSCPGACGLQVVPGLATDMGTTSADGKTWTFHIKPNVKYENGQTVTAADVKYAIERTYDRSVMANGPSYYQAVLTDPNYKGPYKDKTGNLSAIDVPNATTLVFHLVTPYPDLPDVLAFPSSAPVPQSADTGSNY